uniref:Uncharacterized protein n=1 Tax=Rhizophora mucronata TaxID=61149 RepID=A0A2P2NDT4_RHIMU
MQKRFKCTQELCTRQQPFQHCTHNFVSHDLLKCFSTEQ